MREQQELHFKAGNNATLVPLRPFKAQLLKWVGNKQRFAHEIAACFPDRFDRYVEPFLGSGGVLGTLAPCRGLAADVLKPLAELWAMVATKPGLVKEWYTERWALIATMGKVAAYEHVKAAYNESPSPGSLLFISRACYGGVMRFRRDGYISTPCGAHDPIVPASFAHRVDAWHARIRGTEIRHGDFECVMNEAKQGDVIYC